MGNMTTPYDDSFHTLLTDCSRLVIPLVNELFGENWSEDEQVTLYQNEQYIISGTDKKKITDSNFTIGDNPIRYHIECQSSTDGTIMVRIFEYATQISITTAENTPDRTVFTMPASGILYLRRVDSSKYHTVVLNTPGGKIEYDVPILKVCDYSLDEMLEKRLFFIIPFYFFRYKLDEMEGNENSIQDMENTYKELWCKLENLVSRNEITEYEKNAVKAMCSKVATALAEKHKNIMEGVDSVMGGQILDYEAKRILQQGEKNEKINAVVNMLKLGIEEENIRNFYPAEFDAGKKAYKEAISR